MSISRHEARHQALNVLFAADVRGVSAATLLEKTGSISPVSGPVSTDAKIMVALYEDNRKQIDRLIAAHADGWMLKRLAGVDRNAMRLAIAEMVFGDVPYEIAINEAVNLVGELGGNDSPRFVNGVLGAIQRELQAAQAAETQAGEPDGTQAEATQSITDEVASEDGHPEDPSGSSAPTPDATHQAESHDSHSIAKPADEQAEVSDRNDPLESSTDGELQADSSQLKSTPEEDPNL